MLSYNPAEAAQQATIKKAFAPEETNFWNMFSSNQDLTTDLGQQAWATGGLSGQALSELYSEEDQRKWYIQRNAVDYGLNELNNVIQAYTDLGAERNFTEEEATQFEEVLERKRLLEEDLDYVHSTLGGDRDATLFDNGNSFNDAWGNDAGEAAGISEVMQFAVDSPAALAGLLAGEIVKDIPLSILGFFGLAGKVGKGTSILTKVHNKLNKIKPKALRNLAYLGTGVSAGTLSGGGYEAAYSLLDEGKVNYNHVEQGATFGSVFGVLGGLGLMGTGSKLRNAGVMDEVATVGAGSVASTGERLGKAGTDKVFQASQENLKGLNDIAAKMVSKQDDANISAQAKKTTILEDSGYTQEVKQVKDTGGRGVAYSVPDPTTGKMITYLDRQALEKEFRNIKQRIADEGEVNGVSIKGLTPKEIATLKNRDAYEALVLAKEKAKGVLVLDHIKKNGSVEGLPVDLDAQAVRLAKSELDKADQKFKQSKQDSPSEAQAKAVAAEEEATPPPPGRIASALADSPIKSAVALGAVGYGLAEVSADGEGLYGLAAGAIAGKFGGAKLMTTLNKSLNASVIATKRAFSEQSADHAVLAKITEYKMQNILERVDQVFVTPKDRAALVRSLEIGDGAMKFKDKSMQSVRDEVRVMLNIIGNEAVDAGILNKSKDVSRIKFGKVEKNKTGTFLYNYFPHIFRKEIDEDFLEKLVTKYGSTHTPSGERRTMMGTLEEIDRQFPEMNVILDPVIALDIYSKAMTKAVYGRRMIDSLREYNLEFDSGRIPAMMRKEDLEALTTGKASLLSKRYNKAGKGLTSEEATNYEYFNHPSLRGYVAHSNVKNLIDGHFKTIRKGSAADLAESALKFGNGLKRLSVFGSLFHAQALVLSFSYTMGVAGALKGLGGSYTKGKVGKGLKVQRPDGSEVDLDWSHLELGTGTYQQIVEEAISWKLGVGDTKTRQTLNPGTKEMDDFLARHTGENSIPAKVFKTMDHITWSQLHDRFKVAAFLQQRQKLMERGVKYDRASQQAAVFANDAFGGLDWDGFASRLYKFAEKNPHSIRGKIAPHIAAAMPANNRKWFNAVLFAPDWTVSNLRIVGNLVPLSMRAAKVLSNEGWLKAFHKNPKLSTPEATEILAAWKMYAGYTTRAGIQTTALWWTLSQANGMFEGPESPEPDFDEFMKFWITGKLDLGGGETMVISKQIVEPIHWVTNFRHTLMNKGAILPKTAIEGMMNKQWFTLKGDNPYGPAISDKDGSHYFKWLAKKFTPIVIGPAFDDRITWQEALERISTGGVGFAQYQSKD